MFIYDQEYLLPRVFITMFIYDQVYLLPRVFITMFIYDQVYLLPRVFIQVCRKNGTQDKIPFQKYKAFSVRCVTVGDKPPVGLNTSRTKEKVTEVRTFINFWRKDFDQSNQN